MLDALQFAIVVSLVVVAIEALPIVAWKLWSKRRLGRKAEEVPAMTLQDAILFGFGIFATFSCGLSAVWLYMAGWEEYLRASSVSVGVGFLLGVGFGAALYIGNNVQHRRVERRKRRHLDTGLLANSGS